MNSAVDSRTEEMKDEGSRESPSSSQNLFFRKNSNTTYKFSLSESSSSDSLTTVELLKRGNGMDNSDDDPLLFLGFNVEDENNEMSKIAFDGGDSVATPKTWFSIDNSKDVSSNETFDFQAYNQKRVMTPLQERINAITMLPAMFYGVYFVMSGCWARQNGDGHDFDHLEDKSGDWKALANDVFWDDQEFAANTGCINISWLPHLHALPPLPVLAGAIGIVVHAPFSFLYHWSYATKLHPSKRIEHWSRRLDHAFIHFASACMSYATSGRVDYFLMTAAYNLDCAYRQFEQRVRPRRNQIRIAVSIFLYIVPVLRRGFYGDFLQLLCIFVLSGWFFIVYPIGGWSHAMFHVLIAFLPHIIMVSACKLQISQQQIESAAQCAILERKT
eukprot:CCRYP_004973-RA/>CCRYP_004973-RA protein AED:0.00 eAED:0.00 QI:181/1/1/1/0/0/2/2224/386